MSPTTGSWFSRLVSIDGSGPAGSAGNSGNPSAEICGSRSSDGIIAWLEAGSCRADAAAISRNTPALADLRSSGEVSMPCALPLTVRGIPATPTIALMDDVSPWICLAVLRMSSA